MNSHKFEVMKQAVEARILDPQTGDHFTEHFGSVAFIESRDGGALSVCKIEIRDGKKQWKPAEKMLVEDFVKWASYGSTPGTWIWDFTNESEGKQS